MQGFLMKTFSHTDLVNMLRDLTLPNCNIVDNRELGEQLQVQLAFTANHWHFVSIRYVENKMVTLPSGQAVLQTNYDSKSSTILLVKNNTGRKSQTDVDAAKKALHAMLVNDFLNEAWAKGIFKHLGVNHG